MDGGGRLLGSVGAGGELLLADGLGAGFRFPTLRFGRGAAGTTRYRETKRERRLRQFGLLSRGYTGMAFGAAILIGTMIYGTLIGGEYRDFVNAYGTPADIFGRLIGFQIDTITISGLDELDQSEVLDAAGLSGRNSLLFLNAADVRERLKTVPLVREVAVRKLFPNSLFLDIQERDAAALWQKDGHLSVVAADGVAIDAVHDARFNDLPFVVGKGANDHLAEFNALLDASGDMRGRITSGIYVGERRWTLQMDTGVEVMLPEIDPKAALARLATLDHAAKVVDKDLLWLDLRVPGRITARLSEDAAAARAALLAKRPKKSSKE